MIKRNMNISFYTVVEVLFALGLLVLLAACFFASLKTLGNMENTFISENRALLVLDNAVERLEALKTYTSTDAKRIFLDEYAKSCLNGNSKFHPEFRTNSGWAFLSIMKQNGKALEEIKIKCLK